MSRLQSRASGPPDLPGYRFIRHLGAGGNAEVYLYQQALPHRKVAVKVLNESALSEAARRRFTTEANVTAGLAHRHIVQVFDAKVTNDGQPYIVMPYYPQPNLLVRARRAHLSVAEMLRIGIQIGSAVETSHRRGVLHRDIKPQNILTDSYGEPALTDFGIATTKAGQDPEGLSVPWSPPEILYRTGAGDQRSDVYSLGATLWHVLAGRSPFDQPGGDNQPLAFMGRIKSDPVPPTGRADVPDSLERLLRQAMAKDPAARPQTAMELIRGLQSVEQELRLPVTQPILRTSDPGDTLGGDSVPSQAVRHEETTFGRGHGQGPENGDFRAAQQSRGQTLPPPWDGATDARGGASWGSDGPARPAAWAGPDAVPGGDDDPTRARGPRRLDPWSPAPETQQPQTRAGISMQPGSQGGVAGGRARRFPPEASELAAQARPHAVAPGGGAGLSPFDTADAPAPDHDGSVLTYGAGAGDARRQERGKSGRMLALCGGGALLAVLAIAAALGLSHHGGSQAPATGSSQPTQPGGPQDPFGPGPGMPTVTARSIGGQRVEFSWDYTNTAPGDSFRVQVNGGSWKPDTKPDLLLSVAPGQQACIQVQVIAADHVGSPESSESCWPKS